MYVIQHNKFDMASCFIWLSVFMSTVVPVSSFPTNWVVERWMLSGGHSRVFPISTTRDLNYHGLHLTARRIKMKKCRADRKLTDQRILSIRLITLDQESVTSGPRPHLHFSLGLQRLKNVNPVFTTTFNLG